VFIVADGVGSGAGQLREDKMRKVRCFSSASPRLNSCTAQGQTVRAVRSQATHPSKLLPPLPADVFILNFFVDSPRKDKWRALMLVRAASLLLCCCRLAG